MSLALNTEIYSGFASDKVLTVELYTQLFIYSEE